ncbi:MAG: DNA mismatch repair protein [Myxococcota bacterium]
MKTRSRLMAGEARRRSRRRSDSAAGGPVWYVQPVGAAGASTHQVPDLLHGEPRRWGDLSGAAELVRFAFEGGDCAGAFDEIIEATPLAPSSFRKDSFADQLFLEDLIKACFQPAIEGKPYSFHRRLMIRILTSPPEQAEDVVVRHEVFRALLRDEGLRGDVERLALALRALRAALEAPPGEASQNVRRKIEALQALKDCIDALSDGFSDTDTVLSRLRPMGAKMKANDAYRRLSELLALEGHLATVDVRLSLGADGRIRGFGVLAVSEDSANALLPTPLRRFLQRLSAFFRGYRYAEQEVVVRLLDSVFAPLVDSIVACIGLIGPLEFYLAGLSFDRVARARKLHAAIPEFVDPPLAPSTDADRVDVERRLVGLYNPLLWLQNSDPRPATLESSRHDALIILTGPNSGGKTRLLQAVAIAQLLGQSGLLVPAREALLVRAPTMFVSLVVESDAAQVEGRLGTELLRIRHLFEELQPGSLAILDELCSGTNPMEGEAIFEMVVSLLPRVRPQVLISTHFLGLAARLAEERPYESLDFLAVELDDQERPTFGFVPGVAETSLAHKVAARLGVTRGELEELVEQALERQKL